jgi:integrase
LLRRVLRRADTVWKADIGEMPDWSQLRLREAAGRIRELRSDEEARLFEHLREDFHPLVSFCLMAGVRLNNAIRLTWSQVDFDNREIVFRVKSKRPGGDVHMVPVTQAMLFLLAQQRGRHPIFVFTYVCARSRGKRRKGECYPFSQSGWRRPWKAALKAAGIEDFRFHDTRHTAATRTLRASKNLKAVQRMLGHQDITTTARYAHALKDDVLAAMEAVQSQDNPRQETEPGAKPLKGKA